jgi:hypothetical protein
MRLRVLVVALAAAALLVPVAANAAPPPPTLTGEHFTSTFIESVGLCDSVNPVILWHASGIATGPYGGTFNETGRFIIDPAGVATTAPLIDVTTHFTIDSPTGQVEGDKTFTISSTGLGQCQVFDPAFIRIKTAKASNLSYVAGIQTRPGRGHAYVDCGLSELFFSDVTLPPAFQAFGEDFVSSLSEPVRDRPGHGGAEVRS